MELARISHDVIAVVLRVAKRTRSAVFAASALVYFLEALASLTRPLPSRVTDARDLTAGARHVAASAVCGQRTSEATNLLRAAQRRINSLLSHAVLAYRPRRVRVAASRTPAQRRSMAPMRRSFERRAADRSDGDPPA